jgi:hypothetical protein
MLSLNKPCAKERTVPPIAELSLEQIDSLFGLDTATLTVEITP